MLVSLIHTRVWARRLTRSSVLLPLMACSGGDLLLPDDPTPTQLERVSGDGQSAVAGSPVPNPLVVQAKNRAGRPVEGAVILFQFVDPPNGAAIAPSSPETNFDGRASVEVTLGTPAGDQPVEARLVDPAHNLRVTFQLTAIRSNSGGGGGGGDDDDDPPPEDGGGGTGGGGGQVDNGGGGGGGGGGDNGDDEGAGGHHGKGKGKNGNNDNNDNNGNDDNSGQGNGDD